MAVFKFFSTSARSSPRAETFSSKHIATYSSLLFRIIAVYFFPFLSPLIQIKLQRINLGNIYQKIGILSK